MKSKLDVYNARKNLEFFASNVLITQYACNESQESYQGYKLRRRPHLQTQLERGPEVGAHLLETKNPGDAYYGVAEQQY